MFNLSTKTIVEQIQDAHASTLVLIDRLSPQQLMGPVLTTVNPLRWEVGHVAFFYEYWILRQHFQQQPLLANGDSLYDSITILHADRWDLPLLSMSDTLIYLKTVLTKVQQHLATGNDAKRDYLAQYAVFHHDMHNEAFTLTRQTLKYPAPRSGPSTCQVQQWEILPGDAHIRAGSFLLGATDQSGFVFDNEKWAHPININAFSIAKTAVSHGDYLQFVESGGYVKQQYWDGAGWQWLTQAKLLHPVYWQQSPLGWQVRQFDQWISLPLNAALIHVCWHEAQAYCRWAGRRLPSEAEWEAAASAPTTVDGANFSANKRHYPWGNEAPGPDQANLSGKALGTVDVSAYAAGDSAFGCRQMMGNVWEWTLDDFAPYPGFVPDMYQDYSQPLFGCTKVLRGGAWATQASMIRNTWRTYYEAARNDVFAGFRTCAL